MCSGGATTEKQETHVLKRAVTRTFARRTLAAFGALFLISCFGESTGPEFRRGRFALAPQFASQHAARLVDFERVRILISRPGSTVPALDTVVSFPANATELELLLEVPIEGASESFELSMAMINAAGDTVFRSGPDVITASSSALTPTVSVPRLRYTGTGSEAAGVRFVSPPVAAFFQDTIVLAAEAFDSSGVAIAGTPVVFELANPAQDSFRLRIPDQDVGRAVALSQRGGAGIRAVLLTEQEAVHNVAIQPRPNAIQVRSGNSQSGTAGQPLPQAVVARVLAADGLGVQDVVVTFSITAGGGSLSQLVDTTDADGDVSIVWTLGGSAGPQGVSATAAGVAGGTVSFAATAAAGAAARLSFAVEPANVVPGQPFAPEIQVAAQDQFGNPAAGFTGTITLTILNNPGGGALTGTTSVAAVNGVATFAGVGLTGFGSGYTLLAAATGLTPDTSASFSILIGPPAQLAFLVQPGNAVAGLPLAPAVQVVIQDAAGNTVPVATNPVTVSLSANPGGSVLGGTLTVNSVAGVATFPDLVLDKAGTGYELAAAVAGLTSATSSQFDVTAGAAQILVITSQPPSSLAAGSPIVVTVEARDSLGNIATTFTGPVTLALAANPGGSVLGGTLTVNAVNGVATFGDPFLDKAGSGYSLAVAATGLTGATTSPFDITPAAAQLLAFAGQPPASQTAGVPLALTVEVRDGLGNIDTSYVGQVTLGFAANPGGATIGGTATVNAVSGIATFTDPFLDKVGTGYVLTASATGLTAGASSAFDITPAVAASLVVVTQPAATLTAGAPFNLVVTAHDAFGNVATGFSGAVTIALGANPGGATLSGTLSANAVAGVATFADPALDLVGSGYTIAATAAGLSGTATNPFDVVAAAAQVLVFATQPPASQTAGVPLSFDVEARDTLGNLVSSFTGAVTLAIGANPAGGVLAGTLVVNAVAGVAAFTDPFLDLAGAGYTLTASATGLATATSSALAITPAAAAVLVVTTQPPAVQSAGSPVTLAVTARDAFGNVATSFSGAVTIALGANPGGSTLGGTLTVNAVAGVATFTDPVLDIVGTGYTLAASSAGLTGAATNPFDIAPAAAAALEFTTQPPATAIAGDVFAVVVRAVDGFGNTVTGFNGPVDLALATNPGGGTLGGTLSVTAVSGVATFSDPSLTVAAAGYGLSATSSGLAAASSSLFDVDPAAPAVLEFATQPPSSQQAGAAFTVAVQARDAFGNATPTFTGNVTLTLAANPGPGNLGGTLTVAAIAGLATFSDPFLDVAASGYTLGASAAGLSGATSSALDITGAAAQTLHVTTQPPASQTAGAPFAIQVVARDAFSNVATGFSGLVTLSLSANPGGATLSGTVSVNAVAGVANFPDPSLDRTGTGYELGAAAAGLTGANTNTFDITPAAAASLQFAAAPSGLVTAGVAFAATVNAVDAFGNIATGFSGAVNLALGANPGPGTLSGTLSVPAVSGVALFTDPFLDRAAAGYTLQATASGLAAGASGTFDVGPAAAASLVFATQPADQAAGDAIGMTVRADDAFGNLATSFTGTVTLALAANPGGATLSGTLAVPAVAGIAAFADPFLDKVATGYTIAASATGLAGVTSAAFDISAAAAQSLVFTGQPAASYTAGTPVAVTVTAFDQFGNVATGFTQNVTLAFATNPGPGVLGGTTSVAALAGVATFPDPFVNRAAAGYELDASAAGVSSATSSQFAITPAAATMLVFTAQPPASVSANTQFGATVAAQDSFGNVDVAFAAAVNMALGANPTGATLGGTLGVAASAGIAVFSDLTLDNFGADYTLVASSTPLNNGTSGLLDVTPAPGQVAWLNTAGGNWSVGANWSNGVGPAAGDTVLITQNGNYVVALDAPATVARVIIGSSSGAQTLVLPGATLIITDGLAGGANATLDLQAGALLLTGTGAIGHLQWTGGDLAGVGQVLTAGTVAISGTAARGLISLELEITAGGSWTGAHTITHGGGAVLRLAAGGVMTSDAAAGFVFSGATPALELDVRGTLTVNAGTSWPITTNVGGSGTLAIAAGTLDLGSGGLVDGAITVASGAGLTISGGTTFVTTLGQLNAQGDVAISGGTLLADGVVSSASAQLRVTGGTLVWNNLGGGVDTLSLINGQVGGSGTLAVQLHFDWAGGALMGSNGTLRVEPTGSAAITGTAPRTLSAYRLDLAGTGTWAGQHDLTHGGNAVLRVLAGAQLDVTAEPTFTFNGTTPALVLDVGGTLNAAPATLLTLPVPLNIGGQVNVTSGTLQLNGGGSSSGALSLAPGTTVAFNAGTSIFSGASTVAGAAAALRVGGTASAQFSGTVALRSAEVQGGLLQLSGPGDVALDTLLVMGGVLHGSSEVRVADFFRWLGGTISGAAVTDTVEVLPGAVMLIDTLGGVAQHILTQRVLSNRSAAGGAWTSGAVSSSAGGSFVNDAGAVLSMGGSANFAAGASPGVFNNLGSIVVSSGGPAPAGVGTALHNDGSITIPDGEFIATGGGTSAGQFGLGTTGVLRLAGGHNFTAASTVLGQGEVEFAGGGNIVAGFYNLDGGSSLTRVTAGQVDFNFAGPDPDSTDALAMFGGVLGGSATFVVRNSMDWTSGGFTGAAITRSLATTLINSAATKTIDGRNVQLLGTTQHTQGSVAISNSGILRNAAGGTYNIAGGASVDSVGGTGNLFENFGALNVGGNVTITAQFITASPVDVQSGDLDLANGGTLNGTLLTAAGRTLRLTGGQLVLGASLAPGAGMHFEIAGGTATAPSGTVIFDSLTLSGGTLDGAGAAGGNAFVWSGGTLAGSGTTDAQLRLWLPNGTGRVIDGRVLRNLAQGRFMGGTVEFRNGGRLENLGPADFYIQADGAFTQGPGAAGVFTSPGFIQMEATASLFTTGVTFEQLNSLQLDAGRFRIEGSAALGSVVFLNAATSTLEIAGQSAADTVVADGSFDPQGSPDAIRISSGVLRLGPGLVTTSIDSIDLAGGTLDNLDSLGITRLTWTGGTLAGQNGTLTIPVGGTVVVAGGTQLTLDSTTLRIEGTGLWTTSAGLVARNGALIEVAGGGLLEMQSDVGISDGGGVGQNRIVVSGTLLRSAGAAELPIGIFVEAHTGINVSNAGLALTAGGLLGGSNVLNPSTVLRLDGPWALGQPASFSGTGTMIVSGNGVLDLDGWKLDVPRFETQGSGRLVMSQLTDSLIVQGDAVFGGSNPSGSLSAGVIRLQGNFSQTGSANFQPGGTHRAELFGANPQTVSFADPAGSHFRFLAVAKGGPNDTTVTLLSGVLVTDTLRMLNSARILGVQHLTVGRRVQLAGDTATIAIRTLELGEGLDVNAPGLGFPRLTVDTLLVSGTMQWTQTSTGDFQIQDLHVAAGGSLTFNNGSLDVTRTTVDGQLDVGTYSIFNSPAGGTRVRSGGAARFTHFGISWNSGTTLIDAGGTLEGHEGNWTADAVIVDGQLGFPNTGTGVSATMTSLNTQNAGTLEMANPSAFVSVNGGALFTGGNTTGLLTAGTLSISGSFAQSGSITSFVASPGHLVSFNSGATVSFVSPLQSRFGDVDVNEATVQLLTDAEVSGVLRVFNGAALYGVAPASVRLIVGDSLHVPGFNYLDTLRTIEFRRAVDLVGGSIRADTVIFSGANQEMPGDSINGGGTIHYNHLRITASGPVTSASYTVVTGSTRITSGVLGFAGGATFNFGDDSGDSLIVTGTGQIGANDSDLQLNAAGPVLWNTTVSGAGLLGDGALRVNGNFTQEAPGAADNFAADVQWNTRFVGSQEQTIRFDTPGPAASRFGFMEVNNSAAPVLLASDVVVTGNLLVTTTPASLTDSASTANTLIVYGAIVDFGTAQITPSRLEVRGTGAQQLPWVLATNVVFNAGGLRSLTDSVRITGNAHISSGVLDLNNFVLNVQNDVFVEGTGQLSIDNGADTLLVGQDLTISTTTPTVALTQGFIFVRRDFIQNNNGTPDNFAASNDFKLVLDGTLAQTILMQSPGASASRLGEVRVRNVTQPVSIDGEAWINASLDMLPGTVLTGANGHLTLEGFGNIPAGATLSPRYFGIIGGLSLGGTLTTDTTEWLGFGRLVTAGALTNYNTLIINGTGNWTLSGPDSISGNLTIRLGELSTNNHALGVGGNLLTEQGGRLIFPFGLGDLVSVVGDAVFDGGLSQLQGDVLEVGGDLVVTQPSALQATNGHIVAFTGGGPHNLAVPDYSSFLNNVSVVGGNSMTVTGRVRVTGSFTLPGSTVVTGDTLWVLGTLTALLGDDVGLDLVVLENPPLLPAGAAALHPVTLGLAGASPPQVASLNLGLDIAVPDTLLILGPVQSGSLTGNFGMHVVIDDPAGVFVVGNASNLQVLGLMTRNSGLLAMSDPASILTADTARFYGGSTTGLLTAGELVVLGRLEQAFSVGDAYNPSGNHRTHLNGVNGPVSLHITVPNSSRLAGLRVSGPGTVTIETDVVVDGLTTLASTAQFTGAFRLVTDSLTIESAAAISTNAVEITEVDEPLVIHPGGAFNADTLIVNGGDDTTLPPHIYRSMRVTNASKVDFAGSGVTVSIQQLDVEGAFSRFLVENDSITVLGDLNTRTDGVVRMDQAGGLLDVSGSITLSGGSTQWSAGRLRVRSNMSQFGGASDAFQASPAHITEFPDGLHLVSFANPGGGVAESRFGTLLLTGVGAHVDFSSAARAVTLIDQTAGIQERISSVSGFTMTVDTIALQNTVFDNMPLHVLTQPGGNLVNGLRFENMSTLATFLTVEIAPGDSVVFNNVDFATTPSGGGRYVLAVQRAPGGPPFSSLDLGAALPALPAGLYLVGTFTNLIWNGVLNP